MNETCDYILYGEKALKHELAEAAGIEEYFQGLVLGGSFGERYSDS